jgi:hypothetical protein
MWAYGGAYASEPSWLDIELDYTGHAALAKFVALGRQRVRCRAGPSGWCRWRLPSASRGDHAEIGRAAMAARSGSPIDQPSEYSTTRPRRWPCAVSRSIILRVAAAESARRTLPRTSVRRSRPVRRPYPGQAACGVADTDMGIDLPREPSGPRHHSPMMPTECRKTTRHSTYRLRRFSLSTLAIGLIGCFEGGVARTDCFPVSDQLLFGRHHE